MGAKAALDKPITGEKIIAILLLCSGFYNRQNHTLKTQGSVRHSSNAFIFNINPLLLCLPHNAQKQYHIYLCHLSSLGQPAANNNIATLILAINIVVYWYDCVLFGELNIFKLLSNRTCE